MLFSGFRGIVPLIFAEDQDRISNIYVVKYGLHGGFRGVYATMGATIDIVVRAIVFAPGGIMQAVGAVDSDPIFYKNEVIGAGEPGVGIFILDMIEARGGLMAVQGTGDNAGMDEAFAVFIHGHGLAVDIHLDISAGNIEGFAVSGADFRGFYGGKVQILQLGDDGFQEGRLVEVIIDF